MTEQDFLNQYCSKLNPSQLQAVKAVNGPVLLLAVPGSGKTTVLVTRLGYMVCCCGIAPERILTMTYTVAATKEMRDRFSKMFGEDYGRAMEFRTINGLSQKIIDYCSKISGRPAFRLLENEGELSHIVRDIYRSECEEYPTESTIRDIRTAITYIKNMMLSDDEIKKLDIGVSKLPEIYRKYCQVLRNARQMDYDDQMQYALTILKQYPVILSHYQEQFPYICVDESQDTSKIQHGIIRLLASGKQNIFMVGDEDQSIYGFRAAYPEALVRFEETYPGAKVLLMEENYRSLQPILTLADNFISHNKFRHPKTIRCTRGDGAPVQVVDVLNRATQYKYLYTLAKDCQQETAVLYRNNDSAVPLIDLLERNGIPYNCRKFDEVFFSHHVLADIEDIIRFAYDPADTERFLRIYYKLNGHLSKQQAMEACRRSDHTGKSVLLELLNNSELSRYVRDEITDWIDVFTALPSDSAVNAVRRISRDLRYGDYLKDRCIEDGKLAILELIGEDLPSAQALLDRLAELRSLIQNHKNSRKNRFVLSTIHSSKGLEYENVCLLDVLDSSLPAVTRQEIKSDEDERAYYEERRLYYVAVTRAKQSLTLFRWSELQSEFIAESLRSISVEQYGEDEIMSVLGISVVGKKYVHEEYGAGTVIAQQDDNVLIEFVSGQLQRMTLAEMMTQRKHTYALPKKMTVDTACATKKKNPGKKIADASAMKPGLRVAHEKFGVGTVTADDKEIVTIRFNDGSMRRLLKSKVIGNGKLRLL